MNRDELVKAVERGKRFKYLLFWGHTPPRGAAPDALGPWVFSQWWEGRGFVVDGAEYLTAEHFMMAEKARLMGDSATRAKILEAAHPGAAKRLGRTVTPWDESLWTAERFGIVVRGNVAKFGADDEMTELLLATGRRVLVEASPRDRVWGIGLGKDNPAATDPRRWRGENLLGFALMEARRLLRG